MTTPGIYGHYKGGTYRVLFTAAVSTNADLGKAVVIYVSLTTGKIHARDEEEFNGHVRGDGPNPKRFVFFGETGP